MSRAQCLPPGRGHPKSPGRVAYSLSPEPYQRRVADRGFSYMAEVIPHSWWMADLPRTYTRWVVGPFDLAGRGQRVGRCDRYSLTLVRGDRHVRHRGRAGRTLKPLKLGKARRSSPP